MSSGHSFGAELRTLRTAAGLTQEELGECSGIAARTISDLERGVSSSARQATAERLAGCLELVGGDLERFLALARGEPAPPHTYRFRRVFTPPTPLFGREEAASDVVSLLADQAVRLVTLTGAPGVGKTRLAETVAVRISPRFPGGVVDADLGAVWDGAGLTREIAVALQAEDLGADVVGLADLIGERRMLLVLDNFEQVVAEAPILARLIARCPTLKILTTSRMALHIRGEHTVEVQPLAVPGPHDDLDGIADSAAVRMFAACARARDSQWRLDAGAAADVAALCRVVGGIPLAIELATSRLGPYDTGQLARLIGNRLDSMALLTDGPRDLPERQRSLTATLDWTYELLPDEPRALLRRLAVFSDSYSTEAVVETCAKPAGLGAIDALGALAVLVDYHLILRRPDGRYVPYQFVREFALRRLTESGEQLAAETAHARFAVRLGEGAAEHLTGPDQAVWFERLETHHEDLLVAVERLASSGDQLGSAQLAGAVWRYWYARGRIGKGRQLLELVLEQGPPVDPDAEESAIWARAYGGAGALRHTAGDSTDAKDAYIRSIELWERSGDRKGLSGALVNMGMYEQYNGSAAVAEQLYARALEIARAMKIARTKGYSRSIGASLINYGSLMVQEGRQVEAAPMLDEALASFRDAGDLRGEADTQGWRAELALARGEHSRARRLAAAAQALFEGLGDERGVNESIQVLAAAAAGSGEHHEASELYERSVAAHRRLDDPWGISEALLGQAAAALALGQPGEAAKLAREARELAAGNEDARGTAKADHIIGQIDGTGDGDESCPDVAPPGRHAEA
jgi:predicted ATPase/DNA-binding XRE family transcriptional regulator